MKCLYIYSITTSALLASNPLALARPNSADVARASAAAAIYIYMYICICTYIYKCIYIYVHTKCLPPRS